MIPMIDLATPQSRLRDKNEVGIARVLAHEKYTLSPEVIGLEEGLAEYTRVTYCISSANGTDALQIALMALGTGPGDKSITPSFPYTSTEEAAAGVVSLPV